MRFMTLFALAALPLGGCAIADHFQSRADMDQAGKDYRTCLAAHVEQPNLCEPLRQVWEQQKATFAKE